MCLFGKASAKGHICLVYHVWSWQSLWWPLQANPCPKTLATPLGCSSGGPAVSIMLERAWLAQKKPCSTKIKNRSGQFFARSSQPTAWPKSQHVFLAKHIQESQVIVSAVVIYGQSSHEFCNQWASTSPARLSQAPGLQSDGEGSISMPTFVCSSGWGGSPSGNFTVH